MSILDPDDRGFTLGHGLFETLLFAGGELADWDEHLARMARGCPVLGLPVPDAAACRAAADAALAAAGCPTRAAVRLNWSAGAGGRGLDMPAPPRPRLTATAAPVIASEAPVSLATAKVRRNPSSPTSRLKTLAYLDNVVARAEARQAGRDEALMLNIDGHVACAAAANIFWIKEGAVRTPALDCGVLDGIMRGRVLAACGRLRASVVEVRAGPEDLEGAAIFLTNSLIGLRMVDRVDGEPAPASRLVEALRRML